ncbi:MAG TPA: methyltransferase domain-containing protein [Bryobacteraceae bacterium]|nr:methyltransferase domain-containing protein [Bryobacteraceae bacterium]
MADFTGERLIPGQVDVDLFNEHMARYSFAARLARGKRVLDAGCGAGYGSAELAHVAYSVVGADVAAEAVDFAREHYRLPNLCFEQASCAALPHPDSHFDLVVGFEVIEHLKRWREFLLEVRRVLHPGGQFIVSTPNRLYYTESRGAEGANPFHVHEFDFEEFRDELGAVFPDVELFLENHVEGIIFQPHENGNTVEVRVDAGEAFPDQSHFFVAVCAHRPQMGNPTFVYVPRAANVLREREHHIHLLEEQLATIRGERQEILDAHRLQEQELHRSNEWAQSLNRELDECRRRILELQEELVRVHEGYAAKVSELEADLLAKTKWARENESQWEATLQALHRTESELEERTAWARRLDTDVQRLNAYVSACRATLWVKVGRKAGLVPELPTS